MRPTPKKRQGAGPMSVTLVSIKPKGQASMAKPTTTTGNTVQPCKAVQQETFFSGCSKSHSEFLIENHVQAITEAIPKATPMRKRVGEPAAAVM